ncbi:MAG TPA: efflux RND transporter periplasmic adaptor subunit [Bryobacteraceae bacterium]
MKHIEPQEPGVPNDLAARLEHERLQRENQELRRQLEELSGAKHAGVDGGLPRKMWHPSAITIWSIFLAVVVLSAVGFLSGYIPLEKRRSVIAGEAHEQERALPRVEVIEVARASGKSMLQLPGSIQAITEAPILARADGYILRRMVDIGDRVQASQPLAEIEAPEMEEQVRQSKANLQLARAAVDQALANYQQGKSDTELARVTAQRWSNLVAKGVVSRQENDQYQSQYQSRVAALDSLEKAVGVQRSNVAAAEANVARIERMQSYLVVKAPFDGVITLRNVDVGALVNSGSTLLFRIAQTSTLRTYLNVPQEHASSVRAGQTAHLSVSNLPGRQFTGAVARTANALDPASRTLLVEVHVPNGDGALLPGMYARVELASPRTDAPLLIPSDALIARGEGTEVAVVGQDHRVHVQKIEVGRDYGDRLEVAGGLKDGEMVVANPGDTVREGLEVQPVPIVEKGALK